MLKRQTRITFEGLNIGRTLNRLAQQFTLHDVYRQGKICQITVDSRVVRQVVAYLNEKCYNITAIKKIGGSFAISFLKKHFLIPVFSVLAIVIIAVSSNFCWKIEISGDYTGEEVMQALNECNVRVGVNLFRFNADELENKLSNQLDAMYAVVNRSGSALYVNAVKRKQAEQPVDMHKRRDIVATASGKVKYLLCEQGTPLVKIGDTVKKGDVLIAGLRTFNDGTASNVYALGKVVLELSSSAFAKFSGVATETVETGNVFSTNAVLLFGKSYGKLPPFETFRTERTQTQIYPLNLTVEHITYYETAQITKKVTLAECLDELKRQAMENAVQKADFNVQYTMYSVTERGVTATVFGEAVIN